MEALAQFKMPNPVKITGRSSSITNSFINSIIPVIAPTDSEVRNALELLGMSPTSCSCAYCGEKPTEWDHLRPLVMNQRPTGYISEIHNLVPSCGKCNQSKGNKEWEAWMRGPAALSPATRKVPDLEARVRRLRTYEASQEPTKIDFESVVGTQTWNEHWRNWQRIIDAMKHAQKLATQINTQVKAAHEAEL